MTKIVIVGAAGRMGHALVRLGSEANDIEIVGAVDRSDSPDLGKDAGTMVGIGEIGIPLTGDLSAALPDTDVLIDFTLHTAVPSNAAVAAELGKPVVVGTTGLDEAETALVNKASSKVPVVWAPNMSLGVNLLFAMAKKAGTTLGTDYRVSIDETHHVHKKDAPSGTALRLGEKVADGREVSFEDVYVHDEGGKIDDHPDGKLVIRSYREGEVFGDHTVRFESDTEQIELTHNLLSRDALALGALHAAKWVLGKQPCLYDMQDVLGL